MIGEYAIKKNRIKEYIQKLGGFKNEKDININYVVYVGHGTWS